MCVFVDDIKLKVELFPNRFIFIPLYLPTIQALFIVSSGFSFSSTRLYKNK